MTILHLIAQHLVVFAAVAASVGFVAGWLARDIVGTRPQLPMRGPAFETSEPFAELEWDFREAPTC